MKNETELKQNCEILKRIAGHYPDKSVEVRALKKAAVALQLVFLKGSGTKLNKLLEENGKPLTKDQRNNLKKMGLK